MNLLEVHNLKISLGGVELLHGISFAVQEGQTLSIVGPNGAGKSTLVKCLVRIHDNWTGEVTIAGRSIRSYTRRELARIIGYVPQQNGAFPAYSVEDFLHLSRYAWHGEPQNIEEKQRLEEAMERTGTANLRNRNMATLSGGEAQKVLIAAALAQDARMIVLDEPTTFLDPRFQHEVQDIIQGLSHSGITVIAVTHDLNAAAAANRVLALKAGGLFQNFAAGDFLQPSVLESLFDTHFTLARRPDNGSPVVI